MHVEPLKGHFGLQIRGIDLSRGLNDETMRRLSEMLYTHRVIVIRDQHLGKDDYLEFGRAWGNPIPHVLDHLRMPGYPEMMTVGNTEKKDEVEAVRNGTALWHTDQSYEAVPASATMLYSIKVPAVGGETQICNMVAAYQDLEPSMQERLDTLEVAHQYGRGALLPTEFSASPILTETQRTKLPTFYHPLVMRHHVTGEKTLYAVGQSSYSIKGMHDDKAATLLAELKNHVLQEKYIYRHKYRIGDVAIWDTFQTLHSGRKISTASCETDSRLLWRISVRGKPQIYN
ncbi:MAG: TauD/TfdA family dioxygenase [Pseudomonadota bacterium]|nr:TauD/TfdA family dioxygenase [Pseudomonadota bacterium]